MKAWWTFGLLFLCPLVVAVALIRSVGEPFVTEPEEFVPVSVDPTLAEDISQIETTASLTWSATPSLVGSSLTGIVTGTGLEEATTIHEGDVVIQVDGLDRILVSTPFPFYRDLALKSKGEDVDNLHRLLFDLGLLEEQPQAGAAFGTTTRRAVRELSLELGTPTQESVFRSAWTVWSAVSFEVATPKVNIGSVLSETTVLANGYPTLERISFDTYSLGESEQATFSTNLGEAEASLTDLSGAEVLGQVSRLFELDAKEADVTVSPSDPVVVLQLPTAAILVQGAQTCVLVYEYYDPLPVSVISSTIAGVTSIEPTEIPQLLANPRDFPGASCTS